ncbi:MAG: serine/threonine-protein kinase [Arenicellales bacterium]|nr:serine/threonine-protein kinase [Arenicellales bacterium]
MNSELAVNLVKISGYNILHEVGRGGIATVYLAVQESLQREVALKVMSPALTTDPNFTDRFIREGRTIAQLNHPGIVTIYDISVDEYNHYIAMEYLQGGSLKRRIKNRLSVEEALDILHQVTSALEYAHDKGIVHRDVKPENIMFRDADTLEAVLTDFGIAKSNAHHTQLTSAGMIVGTPRYMSPEQADGRGASPQSDLYALGIVLHEMITGRAPYGGNESVAVLYSHINDPIPKLPDKQSFLQPLLEEMLAKDPINRIADSTTLLKRIRQCQAEARRIARTAKKQASPTPRLATKKRITTLLSFFVWGGIAVGSLIIIGTVVWGLFSPSEEVADQAPVGATRAESATSVELSQKELPVIVAPTKVDISPQEIDGDTKDITEPVEITKEVTPTPPQAIEQGSALQGGDTSGSASTENISEVDVSRAGIDTGNATAPRTEVKTTIETSDTVDVSALLELAQKQIENNRLSTPADNNAYDTYRAILRIDPGNIDARNGLKRIADRYAEIARSQSVAGKYEQAISSAQNGLVILPEHRYLQEVLKEAQIKLTRARELEKEAGFETYGRVDDTRTTIEKHIYAAKYGYADAQLKLAVAYANGEGVERDMTEAFKWLRKAADQNLADAQYNLALGLLFGPEPALTEAVRLIKKLAEDNYEPAHRVLGWMYTTGTGVKRNIKEAVVWSAKATRWGAPKVPNDIVTSWQQTFEKEYEQILEVRKEKWAQDNPLK